MDTYEAENPGKHAIWRGRVTKQYEYWRDVSCSEIEEKSYFEKWKMFFLSLNGISDGFILEGPKPSLGQQIIKEMMGMQEVVDAIENGLPTSKIYEIYMNVKQRVGEGFMQDFTTQSAEELQSIQSLFLPTEQELQEIYYYMHGIKPEINWGLYNSWKKDYLCFLGSSQIIELDSHSYIIYESDDGLYEIYEEQNSPFNFPIRGIMIKGPITGKDLQEWFGKENIQEII